MRIEVGTVVRVRMTFATKCEATIGGVLYPPGALVDPVAVSVAVKSPRAPKVTYVFGVGAVIVKDGRGDYYVLQKFDAPGRWGFIWTGAGAGSVELVKSGEIEIAPPIFC